MPHTIYRANGKRVPSVTTILGKFKDPGALMYWSWKCANNVLEEAVNLIREDYLGSTNSANIYNAQEAFLQSNPLQRANFRNEANKAATAGTIAHQLVEQWIHNQEGERSNLERLLTPRELARIKSVDESIATNAHKSFQAFLDWTKTARFHPWVTEQRLVSEEYNFGGTLDCAGYTDYRMVRQSPVGELCIVDWKTSKRMYLDYLIQVAAYVLLWNENYEEQIEKAHVLLFKKETGDFQHYAFSNLEVPTKAFLLMRQLYDLTAQCEKMVK